MLRESKTQLVPEKDISKRESAVPANSALALEYTTTWENSGVQLESFATKPCCVDLISNFVDCINRI